MSASGCHQSVIEDKIATIIFFFGPLASAAKVAHLWVMNCAEVSSSLADFVGCEPRKDSHMRVTTLSDDDRIWVKERTELLFGGDFVVSRNEVHDPHKLPGFIVTEGRERIGLATYSIDGDVCEIVTVDSLCQFMGVGTALLDRIEEEALAAGCTRIWAITTNDNLDAQRFFQKRGFVLFNVRISGMTKIRLLKPTIPRIGYYGIPVRDEYEFEKTLILP